MSVFRNLASSARAAHAQFFGETVTLTESGSAARSVDAVPGKVRIESRTDDSGRQQRVALRMLRFTSITDVRHDATVTIDGETWSIDQTIERTASGLQVQLMRVQTHNIARPNYRGRSS